MLTLRFLIAHYLVDIINYNYINYINKYLNKIKKYIYKN